MEQGGQNITLKIAGKEYALKAATQDMERLMRLAAEDINAMLGKYDQKYPTKDLVDKLALVTLQEAVNKYSAMTSANLIAEEAESLRNELTRYLAGIENK